MYTTIFSIRFLRETRQSDGKKLLVTCDYSCVSLVCFKRSEANWVKVHIFELSCKYKCCTLPLGRNVENSTNAKIFPRSLVVIFFLFVPLCITTR